MAGPCYGSEVLSRVCRSPRRPCLLALGLVLGAALALPSACGKSDACKDLWTKARACEGLPQADVEQLIAKCEADPHQVEVARRTLECGKTCSQLNECMKKTPGEVYVDTLDARLEAAAAADDLDQLVLTCRLAEERASESKLAGVQQSCLPHWTRAYEARFAGLLEARDAAGKAPKAPFDTKAFIRLAEKVSPEAHASARLLVLEHHARRSFEAFEARVSGKPGRVRAQQVLNCGKVVDELAAIDSDWARERTELAAKLCFVELGKEVLDRDTPKCTKRMATVLAGLEAHDLEAGAEGLSAQLAEVRAAGPCPAP